MSFQCFSRPADITSMCSTSFINLWCIFYVETVFNWYSRNTIYGKAMVNTCRVWLCKTNNLVINHRKSRQEINMAWRTINTLKIRKTSSKRARHWNLVLERARAKNLGVLTIVNGQNAPGSLLTASWENIREIPTQRKVVNLLHKTKEFLLSRVKTQEMKLKRIENTSIISVGFVENTLSEKLGVGYYGLNKKYGRSYPLCRPNNNVKSH